MDSFCGEDSARAWRAFLSTRVCRASLSVMDSTRAWRASRCLSLSQPLCNPFRYRLRRPHHGGIVGCLMVYFLYAAEFYSHVECRYLCCCSIDCYLSLRRSFRVLAFAMLITTASSLRKCSAECSLRMGLQVFSRLSSVQSSRLALSCPW